MRLKRHREDVKIIRSMCRTVTAEARPSCLYISALTPSDDRLQDIARRYLNIIRFSEELTFYLAPECWKTLQRVVKDGLDEQ